MEGIPRNLARRVDAIAIDDDGIYPIVQKLGGAEASFGPAPAGGYPAIDSNETAPDLTFTSDDSSSKMGRWISSLNKSIRFKLLPY